MNRDVVLLDVNGTLVPSGSMAVADGSLSVVREAAAALRGRFEVGLCSDSPLAALDAFGRGALGLPAAFPVVAENGNLVRVGGPPQVRVAFPGLAEARAVLGEANGWRRRLPSRLSPEFGGAPVPAGAWAFGSGRQASISLFADADAVTRSAEAVRAWARSRNHVVSTDPAPRHGFLGVHPYSRLRAGKAAALTELAASGRGVVMVGNSESDWVPPESGVRCGFVADAHIPPGIRASAWAVARSPGAAGAAELLLGLARTSIERSG
ncbi:hypothetical protein ACTG9Q_14780 [Actinokineospora sp. 24-640]